MAKRDVQLVIRARSEADRAVDSISSALRTLVGVQDEVSGSGERTSNTIERMSGAFKLLDKAYSKIDQSVAAAGNAFNAQKGNLAENEARYAALTREIHAAEQAIINTRIAMQSDGSPALAGKLAGAQASYRALTGEAGRLGTKLAAQRTEVASAANAFGGLKGAATAAQIAMGEMGDEGQREALRVAAAAKQAQQALLDQAAAARAEVASRNAQSSINSQLGVRPAKDGVARASAAVFEEDARAKREAAAASGELEIAEARAEVAARSYQASLNSLLGVRKAESGAARASAAAFEDDAKVKREAADATSELDRAAERLRARARPLAVEQERINAEMREARTLYDAGKISVRVFTTEMDRLETQLKRTKAAQQAMNRNGSKEFKGVLGLRPYEMQNLSYQLNDVFTQLASGTPATQVFAQQSGQIIQIFPKALSFILKYAKGLGVLAVALTPVIIGTKRFNELAERQREFAADLALSADGARLNAKALGENIEVLGDLGANAEDAGSVLKTFLAESINPDRIDDFSRAAANLSKITGQDLTDSASEVAKAFTGGYDALAEFDDKANFLTATQRELIREMYESGDSAGAAEMAFSIFYEKGEKGAKELETSWSRATKAMGVAWGVFEDYLAGSDWVKNLVGDIDILGDRFASFFEKLAGKRSLTGLQNDLRLAQAQIADLEKGIKTFGDPFGARAYQVRELKTRETQLKQEIVLLEKAKGLREDGGAANRLRDEESQANQKRRQDALADIQLERTLANATDDATKIRIAGQKAYRDEMAKTGDAVIAQARREQAMEAQRLALSKRKVAKEKEIVTLLRPVDGPAGSPFGTRTDPITGKQRFHGGLDYRVGTGTPVRAGAGGSVKEVDNIGRGANGKFVRLEFGNGVEQTLLHLDETLVEVGDIVAAGDVVGKSGNTGRSTGAHLHEQIRTKDGLINPGGDRRVEVDSSKAIAAGVDAQLAAEEERLKVEIALADAVADSITQREYATEQEKRRVGLSDEALLAEERRQHIADAVRVAEERYADASDKELAAGREALALSDAQRAQIEATAAAEFDVASAKEYAAIQQRRLNEAARGHGEILADLLERQANLGDAIATAQLSGNRRQELGLRRELEAVAEAFERAKAEALEFWRAVGADPEQMEGLHLTSLQVQNIIDGIRNAGTEAEKLRTQFLATGDALNRDFAQAGVNGMEAFARSVGEGEKVFSSFADAFLQFSADFLLQLARMIAQQAIFNAISGGANPAGASGGAGGFLSSILGSLFHTGGVVGSSGGARRNVPAAIFNQAVRYHGGGIAGLKPGEVPAILEAGEEVLTRQDARHRNNGGGAGSTRQDMKVVNVFDPVEAMRRAISDRKGQKVILNFLIENGFKNEGAY